MPAHPRTTARPLLAALLAAALFAPPAPARAAGGAAPVGKGDVVKVDLSKVPAGQELRGTATCTGSRITLTGASEELTCERPFTFEGPVTARPVVLTFLPKDRSAPTRLEVPVVRSSRPWTFTAPSDGTVSLGSAQPPAAPAAAAGEEKAGPPSDLLEKARPAAAAACGACQGATYTLRDHKVAGAPSSSFEVSFTIEPAPRSP